MEPAYEGRELLFNLGIATRPVVLNEPVSVRGRDEQDIQHVGVAKPLLHPVAGAVVVVLRLEDGQRDVGVRLCVQDVVGELRRAAGDELAANGHAPLGQ